MSGPRPATAIVGAGVFLSPAACDTLDRLLDAGLKAIGRLDGGTPVVPAGTAELLEVLRAGGRLRAGQGPDVLAIGAGGSTSATVRVLPKPQLWDVADVARESGLSPSFVRRLARQNRLPGARRVGPAWAFPPGTVIQRRPPVNAGRQ